MADIVLSHGIWNRGYRANSARAEKASVDPEDLFRIIP